MSPKGTILLVSPYWREPHRWMVSSFKLAELWQRLGYRVVVACMGSSTRTEKVSDTLTVHFRKDVFLKDPWNYGIALGFAGFVRRLVNEEKPDHIVINKILFWSSLAGLSLRLRGIKYTLLTDALVGITWWPRGTFPKVAAAIYAWTLGQLVMRCASRMVFFHPQPENTLKKLGVAGKSRVIPTGIDPAGYAPSAEGNAVTITYVGRLESVKGVDDYLAAAVPLKAEFPTIDIQVVGWYADNHPLVRQYEKDVRFTGLRDDIPAILGRSDIFVLPSHSEGLSNALMEAMASACACVATDVGGNSYLIQNGVSGLLYPPGDREALRSHLRRLLIDHAKCRALGEGARLRIETEFSWEMVGKKYENLFEEVTMNNEQLKNKAV